MIVSLSCSIHSPQQQLGVVSTAVYPVYGWRLNYNRGIKFLKRGDCLDARFSNDCLRKRVYSVENYEGLWEDPDDETDESEYEDEDEETEESDLDYESEGKNEAIVSHVEELSMRKYEEDLVKEVELLLEPQERAILEQNEAPNLEKLSTAKWKPLHTFALAGQVKFMDELLEKGYNINLVDKDGLTALHLAVIGKREAVISHLLRKGANLEAKDQDGATPLHYAAHIGAVRLVKLLTKYRADVNVADNEGWTPLHVAMQTRNRDIAKILLVNGADRTRRNNDGKTPLDLGLCYGKEFKSYDLAKLLKQVPATSGF